MLGFRPFSSSEHAGHRFGFNGKEADAEVSGSGNSYDYGFRIYNPRVGRFLSVDPLTKTFPMLTPYQFASNTPIMAIDLDGLEAEIVIRKQHDEGGYGEVTLSRTDYDQVTWQFLQNAHMAIAQDATWGSTKGRDSYLSNPVFKKNDGSYDPPVNGILNLTFQNDGTVNASYADRGKKVGGFKSAMTAKENIELVGNNIRSVSRDVSDGAAIFEATMLTATVASGGASSEVTVPAAGAAAVLGLGADGVSLLMSAIMGDVDGMKQDAKSLLIPGALGTVNRRIMKGVDMGDDQLQEAVEAGGDFIESGAGEIIDRSTSNPNQE